MFDDGSRLPGISAYGISIHRVVVSAILMIAVAVLVAPRPAFGQRSAAGRARRPSICIHDCPDTPEGDTSVDDLKDFDHLMAVQASDQQTAWFASLVQDAQAASAQLQALREILPKAPAPAALSEHAGSLDQAVEKVRTGSQNFLGSLSTAQKSGLKDLTEKLTKADSDLDKETKTLDEIVHGQRPDSERLANSAASLEKALTRFQNEEFALGSEMSIILPTGELAFNLPTVTSSIDIAGQPVSIPASGVASRTSVVDGNSLFNLKVVADLSDLQENITAILRSQLTRSPRCGERIAIQDATLFPKAPASLVVAHLHFERWICPPFKGMESPTELADADGAIEIKLTPSVQPDASLRLVPEISRVDADGLLRELLVSGTLGTTLRDQIAAVILTATRKGADLTATLPLSAQKVATVRKIQFQEVRPGQLSLLVDGQLQFSDEQTRQFASQLRQRLSAQQTPAQ
jgi:hypothetical protein